MKELRPGGTRLRLHGDKDKAQGLRVFAMRKLQGFLATCNEDQEVCGPWKVEFSDGSWVKLSQLYDQPVIDIYVPEVGVPPPEEVPGRDREKIPKRDVYKSEDVLTRIVPGFCLVEPKEDEVNPEHDECDVYVCADSSWDVFDNHGIEKEVPYIKKDRVDHFTVNRREGYEKRVWGLFVVSTRGWGNFFEEGETQPSTLEDSLIVPGPLPCLGYNTGNAGLDYGLAEIHGGGDYYAGGTTSFYCDLVDNAWPEEWWEYFSMLGSFIAGHKLRTDYRYNDSECYEYLGNTPCCELFRTETNIELRVKCGQGHFYKEYAIVRAWEIREWRDGSYVMGFCMFGWAGCVQGTRSIEITESARPGQVRIREEATKFIGRLATSDDEQFEKIIADTGGSEVAYVIEGRLAYDGATVGSVQGGCRGRRDDANVQTGDIPQEVFKYDGGILEAKGPETEEVVTPEWFALYVQHIYEREQVKGYLDHWHIYRTNRAITKTGIPRYHEPGSFQLPDDLEEDPEKYPQIVRVGPYYYDHGEFADANDIEHDEESSSGMEKLQLKANIMGEIVVIDEVEWPTDEGEYYFKTLHSNIFESSIFMYSYCLVRVDGVNHRIEYIRYGYFQGSAEIHHQSKYFQPAGLRVKAGITWYDLPYHDVFGSYESLGKYACGLCAAFMIKETREREAEIETNSWRPVNA